MNKKSEEVSNRNDDIRVGETTRKKAPVGLIITVVIIASIAVIISSVLPFLFIFGLTIFEEEVEFKNINENTISIPSENTTIENVNNYYDKEDECYVLQFRMDREKDTKKKSSFFSNYDTTLEVTYSLKDKDGYVIGEETLMIENFERNNKVKQSVYYCEDDAREVDSVEAREVTLY